MVKNLPALLETWVRSLSLQDLLVKETANPLQYCCLENFKDRGACWATVHRVAKSQTRLNEYACTMDYNCQIIPIMILESNLNLDYLPEKYRQNNNS